MSRAWLPDGFVVVPPKPLRQRRMPPRGAPLPVEGAEEATTGGPLLPTSTGRKKDDLGVDPDTLLEALLRDPATYAYEAVIARPDPARGGSPREYALWLWFVLNAYADACTSVRQAFTNLQRPERWARVRAIAAEMLDCEPDEVLPATAPDRSWYHKTRKRHIAPNRDVLLQVFSEEAVAAALDVGLIDPAKPYDVTDRTRYLTADGKVIKAHTSAEPGATAPVEVVNPSTGEVRHIDRPVRFEPDAKLHTTGDKRVVRGVKTLHVDVRGPEAHRNVFLAIDHVPDVKGGRNAENHVLMKNLHTLAELAPGAIGLITDGVLHGQELDEIQRSLGLLPIVPVGAKKLDPKTGERIEEKQGPLGTVSVPGCESGDVELWYYEGRLVKRQMVEDGTRLLVELAWKGTRSRKNKDGTYRRYVDYEVVCNCGKHRMLHRERTITNDEDRARSFNRGENVRAAPPDTELFDALSPLRSPIEGGNRRIDDHLPLGRARSYGATSILLDLLGHAQWVNAYARLLYGTDGARRHEAPDLAERDAA